MAGKSVFEWREALRIGLLAGVVAVFLALVGMVEAFSKRDIIGGVLSMGHTLFLSTSLLAGYLVMRRLRSGARLQAVLSGALAGLVNSALLGVLVLIGSAINLRAVLINATPGLYELLTFGLGIPLGLIVLLALGAILGCLAALVLLLPARWRRVIVIASMTVLMVGLLHDLIKVMLRGWGTLGLWSSLLFSVRGLSLTGAIILFVVVAVSYLVWSTKGPAVGEKANQLPPSGQRALRWGSMALVIVLLLLLPRIVGSYPSEVLDMVGLYVLMGLGLNIVVGFAGLLDLGYVAFFAIGAYTMGVLTSPELGFFNLSFWQALPFAMGVALLSGIILGVPVLKMRGDYLAIVTLGFGEIIRLLALSDWLRPFIGGAQGIQLIAKARVGPVQLVSPQQIYYLVLVGCLIAGFISWRLKDSRLGLAWMALREDEDVAQAMGIDLVKTKLLAFAMGATFAGLSGAIFASKLGSIYPHSFHLLISINVLCLIIVGGMGSIPGVLVGALLLVGLPELLREFAEYRLLVYGAALVIMMLTKPEGFWPEATRRRELHEFKEEAVPTVRELAPAPAKATSSGASQ